jgi:hypothetical protein
MYWATRHGWSIEHLYDRFAQARPDADESRWTYDAHTRDESPWRATGIACGPHLCVSVASSVCGAVLSEAVEQVLDSEAHLLKVRPHVHDGWLPVVAAAAGITAGYCGSRLNRISSFRVCSFVPART